MRPVNGHIVTALGTAAAVLALARADRLWSGDLTPSPFWLATAVGTSIVVAVPPRLRPTAFVGEAIGLVAAGLVVFDESVRGLITPTIGNLLETLLIVGSLVWLLGPVPRIRRTREAMAVLGLIVLACAVGGAMAVADTSSVRIDDRFESWWRWTLGDVVGQVHALPVVLFAGTSLWFLERRHGRAELGATASAIVAVGAVAFATDSSVSYLLVPAALWLAIRFGPLVATASAFASAMAATIVSGRDVGPFVEFGPDPVVEVQAFNIAVAVSAIVGGAHALRADTDRRRVEASERRWRRLVDSAFEGIGRVDESGLIVEVNPALSHIIGLPASEIRGRRLEETVRDTDWPRLAEHTGRFRDGAPSHFETWVVGHDGARRWLRITTRPRSGGGGLFVVADLTEEHDERQRRHAAEHRLETVERDQRDRLARELHDGPVQELSAAIVRLATARRTGGDHPDLEATQRIVERSVDHLRGTLRSLASGSVTIDGLRPALDVVVHRLRTGDTPEITIDVDERLDVDQEVLRTVFEIIREAIANAVIHADATRVEVTVGTNGTGGVDVLVRDDGSGYDVTADVGDEHLGLRIMRSRAAAVGGRLDVRSRPGAGTEIALVVD